MINQYSTHDPRSKIQFTPSLINQLKPLTTVSIVSTDVDTSHTL